ncbi:MAG: class I SAM-dependent methyltransferase [Crocinitomicaceae bacterium]
MESTFFQSEANLNELLQKIERVFNLKSILSEEISKTKIQKYYRDSNLGYNLVHSKEGSVHMAINYDGVFSPDGYYQQVREIAEHLQEKRSDVLELGCGKGFNSAYLSKEFPLSHFSGIDITERHLDYAKKKAEHVQNLSFKTGDFHQLEHPNASFDVVFELEAVCHSDQPQTVLSEVYRVLKPGGKFILYEGFRTANFDQCSDIQKEAAVLIEKTMAVNHGHNIEIWLDMARKIGFEIQQNNDISEAILPNLKRFHRLALKYFKYRFLAKLALVFFSKNLIKNTIAGSLMPFSIVQKIQSYNRIVLVKK